MFNDCKSLTSLPNISNWNTNNVRHMMNMFSGCYSLISLPDLSLWKFNKEPYITFMFYGCFSLISLPNITKLTSSYLPKKLFEENLSLIYFPGLSENIKS